jgi:hypothetical protein
MEKKMQVAESTYGPNASASWTTATTTKRLFFVNECADGDC